MLDPFANTPNSDQHFELNLPQVDNNKHSEIAHSHPNNPSEEIIIPPVKRQVLSAENIALLAIILLLLLGGSVIWMRVERVREIDSRRHEVLVDSLLQIKSNLEANLNQLEATFSNLRLQKDSLAEQLAVASNIVAEKETVIQEIRTQNVREENALRAQLQRLQTVKDRYETLIGVLNQKNAALVAENARLHGTTDSLSMQISEMGKQLENQIRQTLSAQFKASAFRIELARRNDKLTVKARRTRELSVIFELNNVIPAYQGNQQIYLVITDDQGLPITSQNPVHKTIRTEKGEVSIVAQATQLQNVIDNQRIVLSYKLEDRLKKGTYIVSVYSEKGLLGVASFRLT